MVGGAISGHLALVQSNTLAAVDLGSNSFHLQIGRVVEGQIYLLDGLREPVRLGVGLTRDKKIDQATRRVLVPTARTPCASPRTRSSSSPMPARRSGSRSR